MYILKLGSGYTPMPPASQNDTERASAFRPVILRASAEDIRDRLNVFLRQRHPHKTAVAVAAHTGLGAAAVAKWLEGRSAPSGLAMLVLVGAYGPALLAACYPKPPAWLDAAARAQERDAIEAEIARLTARLSPGG